MKKRTFILTIFVMIIGFTILAQAQDKEEMVQLLYVQNAHDVVFEKGTLILKRVNPTTLFFSDRPKRIAGHIITQEFLEEWNEGKNSFAADPPNATLSVFGDDEIVDIVVELKNPRLEGNDLIYDISVIEEDLPITSGPCSLFIDTIGRPMTPVSVAGVHRRTRRRVVRHAVVQ